MKRKIIALCVVVAMLAVAIVSSTMAYFTDTDSAVNVMTMGGVDVVQQEWKLVNGARAKLDPDTGYQIVPAVYDTIEWEATATTANAGEPDLGKLFSSEMGNVYDKFINVKNVGRSAAYVRTFLAFENPDIGNGGTITDKLHISYTDNECFSFVGDYTIDGVPYEVYCYTYPDPLEAGEESDYSLKQFFFNKSTTNEDVASCGEDYKIIAFTQAIQAAGFDNGVTLYSVDKTAVATAALNEGFGEPTAASAEDPALMNIEVWVDDIVVAYNATLVDEWDGTADTSWYNENDTVFVLKSAEALAGMNNLISEGYDFSGKTIKLGSNVDMAGYDWIVASEEFFGTFDGQGNTISNLSRTVNVKTSGRMGLFGHVENGTVKNVTIDSAKFYGYGPYGGVIAGSAYGECVFENITLKNCANEMYNTGSAGIVGLAYSDSNYTFSNINIDESNTIGSYWGSWDTPSGALIGYFWKNGDALSPVLVKDSYIAPVMNVYNDVTANYQWYAYRYAGMLIGYVDGSSIEIDGTTYPDLEGILTCENVTVEYGDWANYYYCELESNSMASYSEDYQFTRLIEISNVDEMDSEQYAWDNHFVLLDGDTATCYHVSRDDDTREITGYHTHTEAEDKICVKLPFDQLYGGGQGVYGGVAHEGVTVIYNNK